VTDRRNAGLVLVALLALAPVAYVVGVLATAHLEEQRALRIQAEAALVQARTVQQLTAALVAVVVLLAVLFVAALALLVVVALSMARLQAQVQAAQRALRGAEPPALPVEWVPATLHMARAARRVEAECLER
jgi:cobalamin synthase